MDVKKKAEDIRKDVERKWVRFKWTAKEKGKAAVDWCLANPIYSIPLITSVIGGAAKVTTAAVRKSTVIQEEKLQKRRVYDPSLGHYYDLKREPSNREWMEIQRRRDLGEKYIFILGDMGLLK